MTFFRPAYGSLVDAMDEKVTVYSRGDLARILGVSTASIGMRPYGYDARIDWDTYIVTVNGEGMGFTNGPLA
jgi:hypothetical protein